MANYTRFQLRGDTKANWLSVNPILAKNEPAIETDTKRFKIGDGVSTYSQLSYGRNTSEYASVYNVTSLYPLPSGFYEHSTAILAVPSGERSLGLIITYETASGVWYTERFIGTDVANWVTLSNWEKLPDAGDLAQLRSDLSENTLSINGNRFEQAINDTLPSGTTVYNLLIPITLSKGDSLFYGVKLASLYLRFWDGNSNSWAFERNTAIGDYVFVNNTNNDILITKVGVYMSSSTLITGDFYLYSQKGLTDLRNEDRNLISSSANSIDALATNKSLIVKNFNLKYFIKKDYSLAITDISFSYTLYPISENALNVVINNVKYMFTALGLAKNNYYLNIPNNKGIFINVLDGSIILGNITSFYSSAQYTFLVGMLGGVFVSSANVKYFLSNQISTKKIYNIFNINNAERGFYIDPMTGAKISTFDYRLVSDFMPVINGESYTFPVYYDNLMFGNYKSIALFDKDKNYIGYVTGYTIDDNHNGTLLTITINNSNASYIRTSLLETEYNKVGFGYHISQYMCVSSQNYPTRYYPYGEIISLSDIEFSEKNNEIINPLFGKHIIFDGDSICNAGASDSYKGWAYRIGHRNSMKWINYSVGGATICNGQWNSSNNYHIISETNYGDINPDYIIIEGGVNDADRIGSIIDGNIPVEFGEYSKSGYNGDFQTTNFVGSVESLFQRLVTSYPNAKIGFIIAHKMSHANSTDNTIYDDFDQDFSKEKNNRRAYFETIINICEKWGIPYLNLWDICHLNPWLHYIFGDTESYYLDGQHLSSNGYEIITPIIEKWMRSL